MQSARTNYLAAMTLFMALTMGTGSLCAQTLLNVDFSDYSTVKTGPAAFGQAATDYWNSYRAKQLTNLFGADGTASTAKMTVNGLYARWQTTAPDPMFSIYI